MYLFLLVTMVSRLVLLEVKLVVVFCLFKFWISEEGGGYIGTSNQIFWLIQYHQLSLIIYEPAVLQVIALQILAFDIDELGVEQSGLASCPK